METVENKYGITIGDIEKSRDGVGWFAVVIEGSDWLNDDFGNDDVLEEEWFHKKRDAIAFVKREHKKLFPEQYKRKKSTVDIAKKLSRIDIK